MYSVKKIRVYWSPSSWSFFGTHKGAINMFQLEERQYSMVDLLRDENLDI